MFSPNAEILKRPGNYFVKCVNNPTAADKRENVYKPRLTAMKRMTRNGKEEIPLKIEFSVAKILFGNNVDEVRENDFEDVVKKLWDVLYEMGVSVLRENIINASVSAFHPSKNIELKDGYTSRFVISELTKINASKKLDLNRDSFRNDGHSLQLYANSHSLVIYDKVQDLRKPEKRAIDKDQNKIQRSLFDNLTKKIKREVLRIEVRLVKKVKMNAVLKKLGLKTDPTFTEVFNKKLCQTIIQDYWDEFVMTNNLFLFDIESNSMDLLEKIYKEKPKIKAKEALYLIGLRAASREGIRKTRSIIESHSTGRSWYRVAEDLKFLDAISDKVYHSWVKQISTALSRFEPLKVINLMCKEL